ncbi:hypothetical protein EDD70_0516 [Hydrogenoanaerobacterium saccharovorans]|uniref:Tight adherence protein C n=1 Tax=Hydrogenoanaerobacterium saccharovorans TaxID=474960 RepID=A0A1H8AVU3_9FIRM|nr:hypothetical protein [Hydrogenoanaerobacterium saccharovorans]RPF47717.1 hypothetical protein EDD70_0516 [Hydrogenoanaerobacterium saccharovorans]SEM74862.1 hypothetical protein SAMN05216180_1575 [Hydrogenoanaerobacterium saccharovorans]
MIQQLLFSLLFVFGIYLLYKEFFIKPTSATVKAVTKVKVFGVTKRYEKLMQFISSKIENHVRIPEYKRNEYVRMLEVLGLTYTPEQYTARIYAQSIFAFLIGLIPAIRVPLLVLLAPILALFIYQLQLKSLKKQYTKRKTDIEMELPKLCSVINSRLKSTSNAQTILSSFLPITNDSMSSELTVTLADMKTGSPETALRRFEGRISSPKVSDVVRGLIAVQNGDDLSVYFQSKQHQFNNDRVTVKKKNIQARPLQLSMPVICSFLINLIFILYALSLGIKLLLNGAF